tara:strand:+ start:3096 stop:3494 length:399 start_codon:yes stop_codon:yes gene_type:complete
MGDTDLASCKACIATQERERNKPSRKDVLASYVFDALKVAQIRGLEEDVPTIKKAVNDATMCVNKVYHYRDPARKLSPQDAFVANSYIESVGLLATIPDPPRRRRVRSGKKSRKSRKSYKRKKSMKKTKRRR